MSTATSFSAEQLWSLPHEGKRYELVAGELRMMSPSGWKHGEIVGKFHVMLGRHIEDYRLGRLFGAETGFLIARNPDTVRAPDIAFIRQEHLPESDPAEAFWPGPPDLAVEVLSPNDRRADLDEKIRDWLAAGVQLVWIVDPSQRTVTTYRSPEDVTVQTADDELAGGKIVPGFRCSITEIFA